MLATPLHPLREIIICFLIFIHVFRPTFRGGQTQSALNTPRLLCDGGVVCADCRLQQIGKALFRRYTPVSWGAWMKQSQPGPVSTDAAADDDDKVWVMKHFTGRVVLQYASYDDFLADRVSVVHELPQPFYGTGHVVYGSAIYYHHAGTDLLLRSDSRTRYIAVAFLDENFRKSGFFNDFSSALNVAILPIATHLSYVVRLSVCLSVI